MKLNCCEVSSSMCKKCEYYMNDNFNDVCQKNGALCNDVELKECPYADKIVNVKF